MALTARELRLAASCAEHCSFIAPTQRLAKVRNELASSLRREANLLDPELNDLPYVPFEEQS